LSRIVRASEIGEYVFCRRAWWLRAVQGFDSTHRREMEAGTLSHVQHGRVVNAAAMIRLVAVLVFLLAVFALLATSR
jgi:CRISPR/Cas system-associated exonuclease Cas4 (RecB family)